VESIHCPLVGTISPSLSPLTSFRRPRHSPSSEQPHPSLRYAVLKPTSSRNWSSPAPQNDLNDCVSLFPHPHFLLPLLISCLASSSSEPPQVSAKRSSVSTVSPLDQQLTLLQAELYAGSAACDRVYITGRRQAQLDSISAANAKIEGILFDPNEVSEIPAFAKKMSDKGLDLVVLNAGMQRGLDFSNVSTERLRARRRTDENLGNSLRALMSISSKRR
jgi:hypothetical protein